MYVLTLLVALLSAGKFHGFTVPPACLHIPLSTSGQPVPVGYCPPGS